MGLILFVVIARLMRFKVMYRNKDSRMMQLVFKNNKPSEIFSQCRFFFAVIFEKFPDSSRVGTKPSFFVFGAQSGSNSCIGVPSILMRIMPFISQEIQVSSESNIDRGSFVFLQVKISIDQGQHRRMNW